MVKNSDHYTLIYIDLTCSQQQKKQISLVNFGVEFDILKLIKTSWKIKAKMKYLLSKMFTVLTSLK